MANSTTQPGSRDRRGRSIRRIAATSGAALIFSGVAPMGQMASAQTPPGAVIVTETSTASTASPGGLAVFDVSIGNEGEVASGALSMSLTLPASIVVDSVVSSDDATGWTCTTTVPTITCSLANAASGAALGLDDFDYADAIVTVAVSDSAVVGSGFDIGVAARTEPLGGTPADLGLASTSVTLLPAPARQVVDVDVDDDLPAELTRSQDSTTTTTIRNLGPAELGGDGSRVVVTGAIPTGSVAVTSSSQGWSCRTNREPVRCVWTGDVIAVGESLPPLAISYEAPGAVTPDDEFLEWTRTVRVKPAGQPATLLSDDLVTAIVPPPPPNVSLEAILTTLNAFEAPTTTDVEVVVVGDNMFDPDNTVIFVADLPTGFDFSSVASNDAWACDTSNVQLQCMRDADFGGAPSSTFTLSLDVDAGAPTGPTTLDLFAVVDGEPDELLDDNATQIDVQVLDRPTAATLLRLYSYPSSGPAEPTDGSPFELVTRSATSIGIDAINNGNSPIEADTEVTLELGLPTGTTASTSTDAGAPNWACSTSVIAGAAILHCTVVLSADIAIDESLPRVKIDLTAGPTAVAGPASLPLSLGATTAGVAQPALASAATIDIVVVEPDEPIVDNLTVTPTVDIIPRVDGRTGLVGVDVVNNTEQRSPGVIVGVALGRGVRAVQPVPVGCARGWLARLSGFDLVCFRAANLEVGASIDPIDVAVIATSRASNPSPVVVTVIPLAFGAEIITADLDLPVLPALAAVAAATPTSVVGQPFGLPQQTVLLDGRDSIALGADVVWRQVPRGDEPSIAFDGVAVGVNEINAPAASFVAPIVAEPTTLHFEFEVSDGTTSSVATVTVDVEPIPVQEPGDETGWETPPPAAPAGLRSFARSTSAPDTFAMAALAPGEPGWVWTTDPTVSPNDVGNGTTTPANGSRIRIFDHGVFDWNGPPTPAPTDVMASHEFFLCDTGDLTTCDSISDATTALPDAAIPYQSGRDAVLRVTVNGLINGAPIQTVENFVLGNVATLYLPPAVVVPPSIIGTVEVGQILTLDPGEWSFEFFKEYQWLRCAEDAATPTTPTTSCIDIANAFDPTYTVGPADIGSFLRGRVTAAGLEGERRDATSASTIEVPDDGLGLPLEVSTDLAGGVASIPNSGQLDITGIVTGGRDPVTSAWTQTGGASVLGGPVDGTLLSITAPAAGQGDLDFTFTATDVLGSTVTTVVTVTYGDVAVPGTLCEVQNAALSAGTGETTVSLGSAITLTFANATVSAGGCSASTTLSMEDATLELFDWMRVDDLSVDVTVDGIDFSGGTLTFPGDSTFSAMNFRVVTDGLSIPFNLTRADLTANGSVIADSLTFLDLPGSWNAGALVSLGADAGVQTIAFEAIAWDTADGAATTSPDALPIPPVDAAQLNIAGSASTDKTFTLALAATGLVQLGAVGLDFSGSIERAAPSDATVITASTSLANPVALTSGLTLDAAELAWDGERFTGFGAIGISTNGGTLALTASFDFGNPADFTVSLTLEASAGTPTWTPVSGLTITEPSVVGTLRRLGPETLFFVSVSAAQVDIGANVALINPTFGLSASCTPTCQPPSFELSGDIEVDLGGGEQATASFTGSLDLADGAFSVTATLANLTPFDGLTLNSLELAMAGGAGAPLSAVLTADATVLGLNATVSISLDDDGFFVAVTLGSWVPGDGAPTFQGAMIVYASYDTDVDVAGQSVAVTANTILITAQTTAPGWFTDLIGYNIGLLTIVGEIDLDTGDFSVEISFDLPTTDVLSLGGVTLQIDDVTFLVAKNGGSITTALTSNGSLIVPDSDGNGTSTLPVQFSAAFSSSAVLSGSITLLGAWQNAFGVTDLTVSDLTVQVSISLVGAGGSFGFAGTAVLPPSWGNQIGIVAGTPIKLVAQVGTADPCFGLEVGNPGSTSTVLDVANAGAVTAKYLSIVIAPTGCTVGPEQLPSGVSLSFDGAVMGVDVRVQASVTPAPFAFSADVEIGTVQISGFNLNGARIKVDVSPIKRAVEFEASATVFGVTADVEGAFSKTVTGTEARFAGVVTTPDLGGFQLDELAVSFDFVQSGPTRTLTIAGSAAVTILGAPQQVAFTFTSVNGRIVEAAGDAAINIPLDKLTITGNGSFRFATGEFPDISLTGTATADGRSLTTVSGTLNGGGLTFAATLGTAAGFSTPPRLSGTVAWQSDGSSTIQIVDQNGVLRTAAPGDFRFDARNVGLNVSGFGLLVDVTVGKVGTTFWAEFDADFNLGAAGGVAVAGSFASNGDFSLTGSAALNLSGFQLPSGTIAVSRAGSTLTVSGDIRFAVPKLTTVRFQGTFTRNANGLFYDLAGTGVVNPGGRTFGSGTFHLYRFDSVGAGLYVDLRLSIPGFVTGDGDMSVTPNALAINTNLGMQGEIGAVLGNPTASVSYLNGPQVVLASWTFNPSNFTYTPNYATIQVDWLTFSVTANNVLKIPGSAAVSGSISSNGNFSVSVSATAGPYSVSKKVGVCKANASASGSFSGTITGTANSLSISFSASLSASAKCGKIKAKVRVDVDFSYSSSNNITIKVRLILDFGVKTWKPTVFSV